MSELEKLFQQMLPFALQNINLKTTYNVGNIFYYKKAK